MNAIPVLAMAVVFLGGPVLAQQATDTTGIPQAVMHRGPRMRP